VRPRPVQLSPSMPRVAVVFTGGTISMRHDPVAGGNVPVLGGAALLETVPGLEAVADLVTIERGLTPASHFTFEALFGIAATVRDALDDPAIDGAVVVQGTDTIEETAFFFDLVHRGPKPLVITGAMRSASEADYDGPANLTAAVRVASGPEIARADVGAVVVLGGSIEAADDVTKTHASAFDAFRCLNRGPLGRVGDGRVVLDAARGP